jgi:hypothetical protein
MSWKHASRAKQHYWGHKYGAKKRGIEFTFSFDEWCAWWESHLGADWQSKRGARVGLYVMARNGDRGPYSPGNVRCILHSENLSERGANGCLPSGENHYGAKLTAEQVREARALYVPRKRGRSARALAKRFGVCVATMAECLRGETWANA